MFERVVVATSDEEVATCVARFGGEVEMTSDAHRSGTDRVAEVASRDAHAHVVVNVQADQPFISREALAAVVAPYGGSTLCDMSTIATRLMNTNQRRNPHVVKVVCDKRSRALYFSRAPIPHGAPAGSCDVYRHIGVYAFRRDFLLGFRMLPSGPLEGCERLEQLRALEHGYDIHVELVDEDVVEVNTRADLRAARGRAEEVVD